MELEYLQALLTGNLKVVDAFLTAGVPVDKMFYIGDNSGAALHLAASTGQTAVVDLLLKAHADVNRRQAVGATPLFLAAEFGHAEVADRLIRGGANTDLARWDSRDAPLHIAADKGHTAVVARLIAAGADVNLVQESGCTPMYLAAQNGWARIVDKLLVAGADIDWRCLANGNSALHVAIQDGHIRIVQSLVRAAANVNLANKKGETALHFAAQNGQVKIVRALLKAGADASAVACNGCGPIHTAAQNGNLTVVKALIDAQADVSASEIEGASPLYIAAQNGHQRVIQVLVDCQADVDHCRNDGASTVYIAAQEGHHESVRILVRRGTADVNSRTGTGEIPLHIAAQRGDQATLDALLQAVQGGDVDAQQKDGCSPLYLAVQFGHRKAVEALLNAAADPNLPMSTGRTPLHAAVQNNQPGVTLALLSGLADPNAQDQTGHTPLDLAKQLGNKELVEMLIRAHAASCPPLASLNASSSTKRDAEVPRKFQQKSHNLSESTISLQLHSALERAGFVQSRAALQSACADVLQRILRRRLKSDEVFIVGSYSEGWGNSLSHLDGRTDPESDIDVMQLIQGRIYHLKAVCQCSDVDPDSLVEYENGHIKCEGFASSPARPENGSSLRPAVDRVSACRLCSYPPIAPLQPIRVAKSNIPQPVLRLLSRELDASSCHVVHAAPPGEAGKQLRVSTTFLERRLLRSLSSLQGQLFVTLKYLVKKVISQIAQGLKAYHAKTITFLMLEEAPAEQWKAENLLSLTRRSLQMLLDCIENSCKADNVDGRIMEHFFLSDAALYLKGVDRSCSEVIMQTIRDVIDQLPQLLLNFKDTLRPIGDRFHFHPFLILPEIDPKFSSGLYYMEYCNIYDIVWETFRHFSEADLSTNCQASLTEQICRLPDCAQLARECLKVLICLKFANTAAAEKILIDLMERKHEVNRGLASFSEKPAETSAEAAVFQQVLTEDFAWRFSLMYLTELDFSSFLPNHLSTWFPMRMKNYNAFYFVNFDALFVCLACELLRQRAEQDVLRRWLLRLVQRDSADVQELLTALRYGWSNSLTSMAIKKFQSSISDHELTELELQNYEIRMRQVK